MAGSVWKFSSLNNKICPNFCYSIRKGHHLRGKPPGIARTLQQRLEELNYKDPELYYKVDIGLPPPQISKSLTSRKRLEVLKLNRLNAELEKIARNNQLQVNLHDVREEWLKSVGPYHIKTIAEHYGVFHHLFGDAYFLPVVPLKITYENEDVALPVYFGNVIKPAEATEKPLVKYESDDKTFWTLILTNPDGHFTKQDAEYVHWFIGNIPGNNVDKGETIVEYLQPFPPKGTGYHRLIFVLYKQEKQLDFSELKKLGKCLSLEDRTFSMVDFYRARQDDLTPAGLSFFQSDWDKSLKKFYHEVLEMREPIFEYDFPPPYQRPQEWFPKGRPFNLYMDRYRDPKQINKEFLIRKLKDVHPFKPSKPALPFPNAQYFNGYVPSWLKLEIRKSRLKWGRINDI